MTLKKFLKLVIREKKLRGEFLNDPIQTLKNYGIESKQETFANLEIPHFVDQAILQGGYRP